MFSGGNRYSGISPFQDVMSLGLGVLSSWYPGALEDACTSERAV